MTTIVIAAHNEESIIGACLDALSTSSDAEIIVAANGCNDDTANVARSRRGVRVLEIERASKPAALNAADQVALSFPRIYLDADIVVPPGAVAALEQALGQSGIFAAVPDRQLIMAGRPWPVRAYFAINRRLPVFRRGLFGRGMIAMSEAGRRRFDRFPEMVADDLFMDSLFDDTEKALVESVRTTVETPARTGDLVRRLTRVRRGNAAMRLSAQEGVVPSDVRSSDRWAWLRDVVIPHPQLAPAGLVYVAITLIADLRARQGEVSDMSWGRAAPTAERSHQ